MLGPLLGSKSKERVLMFLLVRGEGYAAEMASFFETDLYGIKDQLDRLETGGVVVSRKVGRTRVYTSKPRNAFLEELKGLLEKTLDFYPGDLRKALLLNRRRPRQRGKPL